MSLVAGCGGEKKEDAKASDVIKVGVFLPLTGDNAAGGELELRGIKLANKLHPEVLGKKIELVVADNKSDKAEAASVAARLIEKDKVSVITGQWQENTDFDHVGCFSIFLFLAAAACY